MNEYETIVAYAVEYGLGKVKYIVRNIVNYVLQEIEHDKLSDNCLDYIRFEIELYLKDKDTNNLEDYDREWIRLLNRINEVI